jgi:hypothetical protein
MSSSAFDTANRLWYRDGRTIRALAAYEEAARAAPSDPVIAFQLARALSAFDRRDEARTALERAESQRDRLSPFGQRAVDRLRDHLDRPLDPPYPDLPPSSLDRDRIESSGPPGGWLTVARAASAREMHGLAVYALDRSNAAPIDAEDARELGQISSRRDREEALLPNLYAARGAREASAHEPPHPSRVRVPVPTPLPPQDRPAPARPVTPQSPSPVRQLDLPQLPLALSVRVMPERGRAGISTTVTARLINPTDQTIVVNRRLLLNHAGAPGEIWLEVNGPPGYRNRRDYHIRVGDADAKFFVPLAPGHSVEHSWTLNDYQSLDEPGPYEVRLTYHNEATRGADGSPMIAGAVSGSARFERTT